MRGGSLVLALAACGRFGFDESTGASPDAPDTGDAAAACANRTFTSPAASSYVDDFSSGMLTDRWTPVSACIDQIGNEVVAAPPDNSYEYCHAWTNAVVHLTCDRITVRVAETTSTQNGAQTFIYVSSLAIDPPNYIVFIAEIGGFSSYLDPTVFPVTGGAYDAVQDAWWQVRETGGELVFETSPDAMTWKQRVRVPTPVSLDEVQIAIGAGTWLPVAPVGRARFHCFNVPPPCS